MQFHLNYIPKKSDISISHNDHIFLTGSCFSNNIGGLFSDHYFKTCVNPDGILFNPASISGSLRRILEKRQPEENKILQRDNLYFSYNHHSSVHGESKQQLLVKLRAIDLQQAEFLKKANFLIITFGTAYYYQHLSLNCVVANCHKQSAEIFEKRRLTVEEIYDDYHRLIEDLLELNKDLKIIFTVSPVKYLKDGLIENSLSKAILTLAVHQLISQHKNCFYFPAYELVNDDLRDYRFYKEDLAHPNEQAIAYIWQKFSDWCFSDKTKELNQEIQKLQNALRHRRMTGHSSESMKLNDFIQKQKQVIQKLAPGMVFE